MEDFSRVIRPGTIADHNGRPMNIFCKIEFKGGRLSITGVEGPLSNGDARGGCGQIDMHLSEPGGLDTFQPADGWTLDMFREFLTIWRRHHLNDMRAYDAEMAAAGWPEIALTPMLGYEFSLTTAAHDAKRAAEAAALDALKAGRPFEPTPSQTEAATRPYSFIIWTRADEPEPDSPNLLAYKRSRDLYGHNEGGLKHPERKTLGWLKPSEHPDGLLGRKLREDGPGYGTAWFKHEIPESALDWLASLPPADRKPAWV